MITKRLQKIQKKKNILTQKIINFKFDQLITTVIKMTKAYENVAICPFDDQKCNNDKKLKYHNEIKNKMATLRDHKELLYYWDEWHTGTEQETDYKEYVKLMNQAANAITDSKCIQA